MGYDVSPSFIADQPEHCFALSVRWKRYTKRPVSVEIPWLTMEHEAEKMSHKEQQEIMEDMWEQYCYEPDAPVKPDTPKDDPPDDPDDPIDTSSGQW